MKRKSIITTALESLFPYELGLITPPDPLTGSNATIEHNPQARKDQETALERLEAMRPGITKILAADEPWRARAKYLTPLGYHGMVNAPALGLNAAMESHEEARAKVPSVIEELYSKHFQPFKDSVSQEGFLDRILGRGPKLETKPQERLERLEEAAANIKSPAAKGLLLGGGRPSQELLDKLLSLTKDRRAPSMVFTAVNSQLVSSAETLAKYKFPKPDAVVSALRQATTPEVAKNVLTAYFKAMPPLKLLRSQPVRFSPADPVKLFTDVSKGYIHSRKQLEKLLVDDQYDVFDLARGKFNWVAGVIEDYESPGCVKLYEQDPDAHDALLRRADEYATAVSKFAKNWDYYSTSESAEFLLLGRIELLKAVLELEQTNGYSEEDINACVDRAVLGYFNQVAPTLSQESAFSELFSHVMAELQSLLQDPKAPPLLKSPEVLKYIKETPDQVLNQESIETRGLPMSKFDLACYAAEELSAHRIEAMQKAAEERSIELATLTQELTNTNPLGPTILKLCAEGILKNSGNISDLLEKATGDRPCLEAYAKHFEPSKFPLRVLAALRGCDGYWYAINYAYRFVRDVLESKLQEHLRSGDLAAITKAIESLRDAKFVELTAAFPNAMEYSNQSVDEYLDSLYDPADISPTIIEAAMLPGSPAFGWLEETVKDYESCFSAFLPQVLFVSLGKYGSEIDALLSPLAMTALKASCILDRGGIAVMEQVNIQRGINQDETIRLLRGLQLAKQRSAGASATTPAESYSQEAFDYNITVPGALHHPHAEYNRKEDFAGLKHSLFGWGTKKAPTKLRESQKPVKDRTTGGLYGELNEYSSKAAGYFQGAAPAILEYAKRGIAQEERYYEDLAKAVNLRGFSHDRFFGPYLKAQTGVTTYLLDYAKQLLTQNSKLQELTKSCIDFGLKYPGETNMKSMIDAVNGRRMSEEELLALGRSICESLGSIALIEEIAKGQIEDATKLVKVVSKYDVASLEQTCPKLDELDESMGDNYNLSRNFGAYQDICFQLNCCVNLANYYLNVNRPLGLMFKDAQDYLYAVADILAFRLYAYNAMRNSYINLLSGKIYFLDELLETV